MFLYVEYIFFRQSLYMYDIMSASSSVKKPVCAVLTNFYYYVEQLADRL